MGHATHYLEQVLRLGGAELDLAMALYRDPALVRAVVASAGLPSGTDDVALALTDEPEPPHVIFKRDGAFVTCLAAGMKVFRATIVPRGRLDAIARGLEVLRERLASARALAASGEGFPALVRRLELAGPTLSREEMAALVAYEPLLRPRLPEAIRNHDHELQQASRLLATGPTDELVQAFGTAAWTQGHLFVLAQAPGLHGPLGEPRWAEWFTFMAARAHNVPGLLGPFLRAAWAVARIGKPALRWAKEIFRTDGRTHLAAGSTLLAALGLAHGQLRAEVKKALTVRDDGTPAGEYRHFLGDLLIPFVARGTPMPDYETLARQAWASHGPAFARGALAPEDRLAAIVAGDQDLWSKGALTTVHFTLAALVRARPEDLYLPAAHAKALGRNTAAAVRDAAARWKKDLPTLKPVVGTRRPARNEPCPCGSGKKHKRCCGA